MFDYYFDPSKYDTTRSRKLFTPPKLTHLSQNVVSAAMDIRNYSADSYGSEVADHTLSQDCAWRRRMHANNSRAFTLEQAISATPAPLGSRVTKKRSRSKKTKLADVIAPKRQRRQNT